VPYEEKVEDLRVGIVEEYHKRMYDFYRRINKREQIVGWFSTTTPEGEFINDTTYLFNNWYAERCKRPIFVVVDTTLSSESFHIRAYQGKSLYLNASPVNNASDDFFANLFVELKVIQEFSEAESTCLYHMINYQAKPAWKDCEIVSLIPSERERIQMSIEKLLQVIDALLVYIDQVLAGKAHGYAEVGMKVSDIIGSMSTISAENLAAVYRDKTHDLLMVSYLSSLAKTQVLLSEQLNSIL
jgi:translation initiation factor 3 subunit F